MSDQVEQNTDFWTWESDVYNRGAYAKFLTDYLRGKTQNKTERLPFCMALDAKWGAGKTFFVDHWIDTLNKQGAHISFKFNAWEADFQADPLIAFMAEFREAIKAQLKKFESRLLSASTQKKLDETIEKFGKFAKPLLKAMAVGMVNKAIPGIAENIAKAISDSNDEGNDGLATTTEGILSGGSEYITKALDEQVSRKKMLADFKKSITELLEKVSELDNKLRLPIFIFVDELDRCRPDFAVELLEGLKHVFNIEGLCFIVSTNIDQLSHAVTAIYGNGFDGKNYLGRFFDNIYTLPKNNGDYIHSIWKSSHESNKLFLISPDKQLDTTLHDVPSVLNAVSNEFELTPREQEKYILHIEAAVLSISSTDYKHIHIWWLAILAATKVRDTELFEKISSFNFSISGNNNDLNKTFSPRVILTYRNSSIHPSEVGHIVNLSLRDIAGVYIKLSNTPKSEIIDLFNQAHNRGTFGNFVCTHEISGEVSSPTTISKYAFMTECAGHISV